jgi:serine/threonine-protein kinase
VVHRDIKPANMMLTADGVVKVMDFGIAFSGAEHKLTSTGTTMGSLPYMSPEQVKGEAADPRSDLYSLGISLYEMVTGQRPFAAESDFAIMTAHIKETPRPPIELQPGLPAGLNTVILQGLSKEKEQRFQTADEFRAALSRVAAAGETVVFAPSSVIPADASKPRAPYTPPPAEPAPASVAAPTPEVPPQPARQGGHRALYMSLGAVLALVLLIIAGTYYRTGAVGSAEQNQPTLLPVSEDPPETMPAVEPEAMPAVELEAKPALEPPSHAEPVQATPKALSGLAATAPAEPSEKEVEETSSVPDNSAQLDELERQLDQLTSRALAVDSSLETLRRQQRAAGFDLRGDIAGKWENMKVNLAKAQQSFDNGDVTRGKKYADMAANYLRQLERFLGR